MLADFFSDENEATEAFEIGTAEDLDRRILTAKVRVAAWTESKEPYYISINLYQGKKLLSNGHVVSQGTFEGVKTEGFQFRFQWI